MELEVNVILRVVEEIFNLEEIELVILQIVALEVVIIG